MSGLQQHYQHNNMPPTLWQKYLYWLVCQLFFIFKTYRTHFFPNNRLADEVKRRNREGENGLGKIKFIHTRPMVIHTLRKYVHKKLTTKQLCKCVNRLFLWITWSRVLQPEMFLYNNGATFLILSSKNHGCFSIVNAEKYRIWLQYYIKLSHAGDSRSKPAADVRHPTST